MTARVYVTLKKAVLDPQGKAVQRLLARLGFPQARERSCRAFRGDRARGAVKADRKNKRPFGATPAAPPQRAAAARRSGPRLWLVLGGRRSMQ
jgi:hypothetical protein